MLFISKFSPDLENEFILICSNDRRIKAYLLVIFFLNIKNHNLWLILKAKQNIIFILTKQIESINEWLSTSNRWPPPRGSCLIMITTTTSSVTLTVLPSLPVHRLLGLRPIIVWNWNTQKQRNTDGSTTEKQSGE